MKHSIMAALLFSLIASANANPLNSGTTSWATQLIAAIQKKMDWPAEVKKERLTGVLSIQLSPSGHVKSIGIRTSSGSESMDTAMMEAVLRASPLPLPADPSDFQSGIVISFSPL